MSWESNYDAWKTTPPDDDDNDYLFVCDCCGEGIYHGNTFYNLPNGDRACETCVSDMQATAWVD